MFKLPNYGNEPPARHAGQTVTPSGKTPVRRYSSSASATTSLMASMSYSTRESVVLNVRSPLRVASVATRTSAGTRTPYVSIAVIAP